ncbi:MAG: hypothetical protein MK132_17900 [Lentisphaerales bacterium]|nr:hypothetical protein [Lentisphaerales bacterium]
MCSSIAEKDKVTEAIKSGANNYVIKAFNADSLKIKVESLIDRDISFCPTLAAKLKKKGINSES